MVVGRKELKSTLARTLRWLEHGRAPERRTGVVGVAGVVDGELEVAATD
jgi:hypothetical protein